MRLQHWLYLHGRPIYGTMLEAGSSIDDVLRRFYHELDVCPGVICDYPYEAPFEKRYKSAYAELRVFN